MRNRLTAWMALFAMLTGIALPAHAYRIHAVQGVPGADFCSTVKPADAAANIPASAGAETPVAPERDHAVQCDTCCGCSGVAAAAALPRSWPARAATLAVPGDVPAFRRPALTGLALARGPPAPA